MKGNIENSVSRIWTPKEINETIRAIRKAGYDVTRTKDTIEVGFKDTGQRFMWAGKLRRMWIVRYDTRLFGG